MMRPRLTRKAAAFIEQARQRGYLVTSGRFGDLRYLFAVECRRRREVFLHIHLGHLFGRVLIDIAPAGRRFRPDVVARVVKFLQRPNLTRRGLECSGGPYTLRVRAPFHCAEQMGLWLRESAVEWSDKEQEAPQDTGGASRTNA